MAPFLRSSRRLPSFLLDIDGTLVFTDHLYRKVFEKLLSPLGYDVTDEFYAANVHGKVDADVFGKLLPADTSEDELKAWSKLKDSTFVELYNEQIQVRQPRGGADGAALCAAANARENASSLIGDDDGVARAASRRT